MDINEAERAFESARQAYRLGFLASAVAYLEPAAKFTRHPSRAYNELGRLHGKLGHIEEALYAFEKAVNADNQNDHAWHNMGILTLERGQISRSFQALKTALKINPTRSSSLFALTELLFLRGQEQDAKRCWALAKKHGAENWASQISLARRLSALGYSELADEEFQRLSLSDSMSPADWFAFGENDEDRGSRERAVKCYESALALDAEFAPALGRILAISSSPDAAWVEHANLLLRSESLSPTDKSLIGYGLGKTLERSEDFSNAFEAYAAANAARRAEAGEYEHTETQSRIQSILGAFHPRETQLKSHSESQRRPVFIVGMPRSGTTLTEQILAAHSLVHGAGELTSISRIASELKRRFSDGMPYWDRIVPNLTDALCREAARDNNIDLWQRAAPNAIRAIDKSPLNFFHLGLIERLYPDAFIIHCTRDPKDICFSIFSENFALSQRHATRLHDLAQYWAAYNEMMRVWEERLSNPILTVKYEETVADLEGTARKLCKFVGVEWEEECLNFHQTERAVSTPSRWQVRQPIYDTSVARWERFKPWIEPLLTAFPGKDPHQQNFTGR